MKRFASNGQHLSLTIASLEVDKTKWEIAELKAKRLPSIKTAVLGSQLLNEISFAFKEGVFGNFPSTGPIPDKDTKITTPRRPRSHVVQRPSESEQG